MINDNADVICLYTCSERKNRPRGHQRNTSLHLMIFQEIPGEEWNHVTDPGPPVSPFEDVFPVVAEVVQPAIIESIPCSILTSSITIWCTAATCQGQRQTAAFIHSSEKPNTVNVCTLCGQYFCTLFSYFIFNLVFFFLYEYSLT